MIKEDVNAGNPDAIIALIVSLHCTLRMGDIDYWENKLLEVFKVQTTGSAKVLATER